jgi:hypothetical protein
VSWLLGTMAGVWTWFRDALVDNFGLKALSLAFSLGFFIFLHGQEEQQQRTIPVGVVLRMPPEEARRDLMTPVPASIHITVRGSVRAIDRMLQSGLPPVELDLRAGSANSVGFERGMFKLPPDVELTIIDPPSLDLEWQPVIERKLPIQASISGTPASGYVVKGEPKSEPADVVVRGPQSLVEVVQSARIAPFDVSGLTEGIYRRPLAIDPAPTRLRYLTGSNAVVSVAITQRLSEVKFARRRVEVLGVSWGRASPESVDVTVVASPEVVRTLRPEQVVPVADLTRLEGFSREQQPHGVLTVPITVDLANAQAEVQPPTVTVRW